MAGIPGTGGSPCCEALLKSSRVQGVRRGSPHALQGCINDAHCMRYMLMNRLGFGDADIQMLTDDLPFPAGWPTRSNMLFQVGGREVLQGVMS